MRALITGGAGFVGQWLARALLERGDDVYSAGLGRAPTAKSAVLSSAEREHVHWQEADMRLALEVEGSVDASRPDVIFHLAGVSFPPDAERRPELTYDVNVLGAARLLASVERRRAAGELDPVVVVVGTGVQYGRHDAAEMPLSEDAALRPLSIYGASKTAQEIVALESFRRAGTRVVCARSFNHSGVGHPPQYVVPSLVARAAQIRAGTEKTLKIGNDVVRDFLHVSDVVRAYLAMAERGRAGEVYNVASGVGVSTRRLAQDVLLRAGLAVEITSEPTLARATDIPILIGSSARLTRDTGWAPTRTHTDIIDDFLNAQAD